MPQHGGDGSLVPAHPHLPSMVTHPIFSAPVVGWFMLKQTLDATTQKWTESTVREGATAPTAGSRGASAGGLVKLSIGGAPAADAPTFEDLGVGEVVLGASGGGSNMFGKFSWTGAYRPSTGDLLAYKTYVSKAAPAARPAASRARAAPAAAAAAAAAAPPEARKTRLRAGEDAPEEGAAERAAALADKAAPQFKVNVAPEIKLLLDAYLFVRNHKYRPVSFIEPVDAATLPLYYETIKKPMCLVEVEKKLTEVRGVGVHHSMAAGRGCGWLWVGVGAHPFPIGRVPQRR